MSNDWARITIITAAAAGGIRVRGEEFAFLVRDTSEHSPDIAVKDSRDLRVLVPSLYPKRIDFQCSDAERPALRALVEFLRCGLHVIEGRP